MKTCTAYASCHAWAPGQHPRLLRGAAVQLGGTRVCLLQQAVARVQPLAVHIFAELIVHERLRGMALASVIPELRLLPPTFPGCRPSCFSC
jgi:hypothetical protein